MTHLFLGLPPSGIGVLPFSPVTRHPPAVRASDLGLLLHPHAVVEAVPSISGHVGGDLVADACAARLLERRGLTMLVDIGTNGEILLWDGRHLHATATAAGPAFEGGGLAHGGRAAEGAIDHLVWREEKGFESSVIGGTAPRSLCGSAVIDFIAEGRRAGWINEHGRFDTVRLRKSGAYLEVSRGNHALRAAAVTPSGKLWVSEHDVSEVLKAKAAIFAGMRTILAVAGRTWKDLDTLLLAGGFARYIHLRQATTMGLLPVLDPGVIRVIGNGSLSGACLALLDESSWGTFDRVLAAARPLELNLHPDFENHFIDALFLP
jgi:uncharacterized 2Fe-2S/4Fe-4S cluster protein (DUF4445 family)